MFAVLARIFAGPMVSGVLDVVKQWQNRKLSEAEMRAEINKAILGTLSQVSDAQANVIMAEARGESWLQRNWRPIVALTSFFTIFYVIIVVPHLVMWGVMSRAPGFGEVGLGWFFTLTTMSVGGYMGVRTIEKIADKFAARRM